MASSSPSPSPSDIKMGETLDSMPSASTDTKMAETETAVSSSSMPTSDTKMAETLHSTPSSSSSSDTKMSETLAPASDVKMAAETLEFKPSASSDVKMDVDAEAEKAKIIADMMARSLSDRYKEEAIKLWRVLSTLLEMLSDRGYIPETENEIFKDPDDQAEKKKTDMEEEEGEKKKNKKAAALEAFVNKYGKKKFNRKVLNSIFVKENEPDCKICVFFYKGITAKKLKSCFEHSCSVKAARGIVVVEKAIPEYMKSFMEEFNADIPSYRFELFQEAELVVNVSKHDRAPKHVLLSSDEKCKLLERYKVKETQLPKILVTDVQARYLGACPGQVIKVIRPSETAGQFVAVYRFVIPTPPPPE
ncbi:DNA-directed RNA polymerases II and IV subunit 5A [Cinnamomum micranthum f. kanehirae]|uniref:DNA-directed RNA polymerases II and IV subunit 5A n=1 Tax=Cinnamomum micranthum f. kanehirae TaxID=337451 RepID=A0A443Q229_9MAGN|nr:DNA-directed RNA polymerases II and IV subunit 5A [Cinnamomum micranthum f. kanehirae]